MSETEATKGPWVVGKIGRTVVSSCLSQSTQQDKISGHGDIAYYGGLLVCESIRTNSDALLIAKAPEMLEVLQILVGDIERHPKKFSREEKLEMAKKVIKEATEL